MMYVYVSVLLMYFENDDSRSLFPDHESLSNKCEVTPSSWATSRTMWIECAFIGRLTTNRTTVLLDIAQIAAVVLLLRIIYVQEKQVLHFYLFYLSLSTSGDTSLYRIFSKYAQVTMRYLRVQLAHCIPSALFV